MEKKGAGFISVIAVIVLLGLLGSCAGDTEYERAGKEFGSWVNTDPSGWTDTQKNYFNDFMEWSDNN